VPNNRQCDEIVERRRILPPDYDETLTDPASWSNRTKKYPLPTSYTLHKILSEYDNVLPVDVKELKCPILETQVDKYEERSKKKKAKPKKKKSDSKEEKADDSHSGSDDSDSENDDDDRDDSDDAPGKFIIVQLRTVSHMIGRLPL